MYCCTTLYTMFCCTILYTLYYGTQLQTMFCCTNCTIYLCNYAPSSQDLVIGLVYNVFVNESFINIRPVETRKTRLLEKLCMNERRETGLLRITRFQQLISCLLSWITWFVIFKRLKLLALLVL